jgi:hypothetical protein
MGLRQGQAAQSRLNALAAHLTLHKIRFPHKFGHKAGAWPVENFFRCA